MNQMLQAQKNDWRVALCITAVITSFSVFTGRVALPLYAIAVSCLSVSICTLFKALQRQQFQEEGEAVVWYTQEKFRILLASAFFFFLFLGLGFSDGGSIPAQYHAVLAVILLALSFAPFSAIFFALVYIRSSFSEVETLPNQERE